VDWSWRRVAAAVDLVENDERLDHRAVRDVTVFVEPFGLAGRLVVPLRADRDFPIRRERRPRGRDGENDHRGEGPLDLPMAFHDPSLSQ
jgi:hypothetical protein